jgi:hypothetical protein
VAAASPVLLASTEWTCRQLQTVAAASCRPPQTVATASPVLVASAERTCRQPLPHPATSPSLLPPPPLNRSPCSRSIAPPPKPSPPPFPLPICNSLKTSRYSTFLTLPALAAISEAHDASTKTQTSKRHPKLLTKTPISRPRIKLIEDPTTIGPDPARRFLGPRLIRNLWVASWFQAQ